MACATLQGREREKAGKRPSRCGDGPSLIMRKERKQLGCSIQRADPINKLFHIFDILIGGILRVDAGAIQNHDLNALCPQRFQSTRETPGFPCCFAAVGQTALLVEYFRNDINHLIASYAFCLTIKDITLLIVVLCAFIFNINSRNRNALIFMSDISA